MRIDAKRLRYAVEGFAPLFRTRRVGHYLETLSGLQDVLGGSNDATTAERLLAGLGAPRAFMQFARGYLAARIAADVRAAGDLVAKLAATRRFWS